MKNKKEDSGKSVDEKINKLAKEVLNQIEKNNNPTVDMPLRGITNVYCDEKNKIIQMGNKTSSRSFFNLGQSKKFMQTFLAAKVIQDLIKQNITVPIRSIYYNTKHTIEGTKEETWNDQSESDPITLTILFLLSHSISAENISESLIVSLEDRSHSFYESKNKNKTS